MTSLNDRRVLILAVVAIVLTGTFDAGLLIPTLLHVSSPSADFTYLLIALFVGSIASAFAIFPIVIYLYRRTVRLQDAVNHYIRNRMQEIISTLDVLQNEIEPHLSDKQKAEMISNVRQICYRVANTLPQRIMIEAPTSITILPKTISNKVIRKSSELLSRNSQTSGPYPNTFSWDNISKISPLSQYSTILPSLMRKKLHE